MSFYPNGYVRTDEHSSLLQAAAYTVSVIYKSYISAVMWCPCSFAEMFQLRTLLARLDYILGHKSQHMLSEWLLWGICPYCSVTVKLLSSFLLSGWITYSTVCPLSLCVFSSASVCIPFTLHNLQEQLCTVHAVILNKIDSKNKVHKRSDCHSSVHWFRKKGSQRSLWKWDLKDQRKI